MRGAAVLLPAAVAVLQLLPLAAGHGGDAHAEPSPMSGGHGHGHGAPTEPAANVTLPPSLPSYASDGGHGGLIMTHIALSIIAWVVVLPLGK